MKQIGLFAPKPIGVGLPPCRFCGERRIGHVYSALFGRAHPGCLEEAQGALRDINPNPLMWPALLESLA